MPAGKDIAFIGGGHMSEALIAGLSRQKLLTPERVTVSDPQASRRELLASRFGVITVADNENAANKADIIVLCVEPQILDEVLDQLRPVMQAHPLIISVAAGYPLSRIETHVKPATRLVRAMPNTPATIGEGATALSFVPGLSAEDHHMARSLFESVGKVVVVEERLMDAVTGLSGSGPAYVFAMIEALADGGVLMGLPRTTSQLLAAQTLAGAARMVLEQGEHPAVLKDRVASPGGTTIAGLRRLEEGKLRATLMAAVEAATRRSQDLGKADHSHP
ncbi:MAG: proC [Nitrospira sp.]|jgi:pyrroline-5-carboxylate reductase|nr:proC [Nitrospira sp.]